jgi:hypothetical protein
MVLTCTPFNVPATFGTNPAFVNAGISNDPTNINFNFPFPIELWKNNEWQMISYTIDTLAGEVVAYYNGRPVRTWKHMGTILGNPGKSYSGKFAFPEYGTVSGLSIGSGVFSIIGSITGGYTSVGTLMRFPGALSEFSVYDRPLRPSDIRGLHSLVMNNRFTPTTGIF